MRLFIHKKGNFHIDYEWESYRNSARREITKLLQKGIFITASRPKRTGLLGQLLLLFRLSL